MTARLQGEGRTPWLIAARTSSISIWTRYGTVAPAQHLLRIALPLGGVGLIIGFLLGIAVYADTANRAGVLGLSDTLLHSMQDRIAQRSPPISNPPRTPPARPQHVGRGGATDHADEAYVFAASVLNETPQVANVLFADAAGDFMLVTRAADGPPGATRTKRVLLAPEGRSVAWISRDPAGQVTARRQDPADTYDARTRPWFIGARAADDVFWSRVYIFFTERAPGITAAAHGPGQAPTSSAWTSASMRCRGFSAACRSGAPGAPISWRATAR